MEADSRRGAVRAYVPVLAALVPFGVYVFTTGASSYWLDSGEFTAAGIYLDIAHPPGHPLACLWSKLFALLPLGPLPFRVALGQGVATALGLSALSVAFGRTLRLTGLESQRTRELLSLSGTWFLASSHAFWFQSVRQEVYALQALFLCVSLERLTRAAELGDADVPDPRPFYAAVLALSLGLANHHFISVLGIPAILHELVRLTRRHGPRPWLMGLALALLGLFAYVYLPIRASTRPPMDLGHPVALGDFAWVVSAQVYARRVGLAADQPLGERMLDLVVLIVENLGWLVLLFALLGAYLLCRLARWRGLAWVWGITALVSLVGRAALNEVRGNPDVLGYMMPGFAALVALALVGFACLLDGLARERERVEVAAALALLLLAPLGFVLGGARSSLASFHAADDFDTPFRRDLPAQSLLVLSTPDAAFRHWGGEAVERTRPDVTLVPLPFVRYGASGEQLVARHAELAPLLRTYLETDRLDPSLLRALAQQRPVLIEADVSETLPLYPFLVPEGLLYRFVSEPPDAARIRAAASHRAGLYQELLAALGSQVEEEETRKKLLWLLYVDALYYASHGVLELARAAAEQGLVLAPHTGQLVALRTALVEHSGGPFDIRPFVVTR